VRHRRACTGFLSRTGTSIGLSGLQRNPTEGLGCGMGMGRATGWLCVVMAFAGVCRAMPISQFDKMQRNDRELYVGRLLDGTVESLKAHGREDQAQQVLNLFADRTAGGGIERLEMNLKAFRQVNRQHQDDVNNTQPTYQVEDAFALTLKNQGIDVPVSFLLTINKNFKPS
jgi:hypothetical protein